MKLAIDLNGDITKSKQLIPTFTSFNKLDRDSKFTSIVRPSKNPTSSNLPSKNLKFNNEEHIERN